MLEAIREFFASMSYTEIIGQIIGFFGTAAFFVSYQKRRQQDIIFWQIIGISLFVVHFFTLGAYTGAFMNILGLIRAVVYYYREGGKKWAKSKLWFCVLMISYIAVGIVTWEDMFSVLPLAAMCLSTLGFEATNVLAFRLYNFPCSPMWLVYNIHNGSVSGTVTECFTMTSMIIALVRYYVFKSKSDKK